MAFNLSSLGSLTVVVVSAVELKNRDGLFGKNDAYTLLKVGKQRGRTKTKFNAGSKATWNEEFTFQIYGKEDLEIICYDYDKFSSDDIIGSTTISLNTLFEINYIENWFNLTHKGKYCGKVHLRVSFTIVRPNSPPLQANNDNLRHSSSLASRISNSNDVQPNSHNRLSPVPQIVSPSSYPPSGGSSFPASIYPPPSSPSHSPYLYPQPTISGGTYISNSGQTSPNSYNGQSRPNFYNGYPISPPVTLYPPPCNSVGSPSNQSGYPSANGYPSMTSNQPYPPTGSQVHPPSNGAYSPTNGVYPPVGNQAYPLTQSQVYPPSNGVYPPTGSQACPPTNGVYPPTGSQVYPPSNDAHPPTKSS